MTIRDHDDKPMLGLRREDKNHWERRTPLTPDHVRHLVDQGVRVRVQPSTVRIFSDDDYRAAGALVDEDLSSCPVVFGVKEIPAALLPRNPAAARMAKMINPAGTPTKTSTCTSSRVFSLRAIGHEPPSDPVRLG